MLPVPPNEILVLAQRAAQCTEARHPFVEAPMSCHRINGRCLTASRNFRGRGVVHMGDLGLRRGSSRTTEIAFSVKRSHPSALNKYRDKEKASKTPLRKTTVIGVWRQDYCGARFMVAPDTMRTDHRDIFRLRPIHMERANGPRDFPPKLQPKNSYWAVVERQRAQIRRVWHALTWWLIHVNAGKPMASRTTSLVAVMTVRWGKQAGTKRRAMTPQHSLLFHRNLHWRTESRIASSILSSLLCSTW